MDWSTQYAYWKTTFESGDQVRAHEILQEARRSIPNTKDPSRWDWFISALEDSQSAGFVMDEGRILAHAVENRSDGKIWYIPPGGGIDYGESSSEVLRREMKEELNWEIEIDHFIGAFESFHIINGTEEHEISFIYAARPTDRSNFELPGGMFREADGIKEFRWIEMEALKRPESLLYPKGLLETVEGSKSAQAIP